MMRCPGGSIRFGFGAVNKCWVAGPTAALTDVRRRRRRSIETSHSLPLPCVLCDVCRAQPIGTTAATPPTINHPLHRDHCIATTGAGFSPRCNQFSPLPPAAASVSLVRRRLSIIAYAHTGDPLRSTPAQFHSPTKLLRKNMPARTRHAPLFLLLLVLLGLLARSATAFVVGPAIPGGRRPAG